MSLTQANRFVAVQTPLGADALVVRSVSCTEQMSRLFQIELDLISADGEIEFEQIIGESATIRLEAVDDQTRYFNGVISRFVQTKNDGSFAHYRATVVPWLWLLTRTSDCRIFQQKSVPDVIEEVFKGHGLDSYRLSLSGTYKPWEYCVQYRETDFNFVSRLMEQEGIYYFFEHEDGKHTLVLADSPSAHETYSGYETLIYRPPTDTQPVDRECVTDWVVEKELKTGVYALKDFNFKSPKTNLEAKSDIARPHAAADFEVYDYPGEYEEHPEGLSYAKVRIEELQSTYETLHAQATVRGICPGHLFTLEDHPREDQNREYLITGMSCEINAGDFESGAASEAEEHFTCSFTCIDSQTPFRPARITPKPLIQGPQTAMVSGPKGEEIHTDEHGRVKVQFHWDRYGKADENSSCWVRVSQVWAGKNWGVMHIPRIGQEVIVEFLEGDPDRPIITGRVYNGEATPPYDLPANKTQSGIKSRSSKGGGAANFNEIRFEDKKGSEEIVVHAEKNLSTTVEANETHNVGHDRTTTIGHDEKLTIKNDQTEEILGYQKETVHKACAQTIYLAKALNVGLGYQVSVGGAMNETVIGAKTEEVGGYRLHSVGLHHSVKVAKGYSLKAKDIVIDADEKIEIKCGSASITLNKDGLIQINGTSIDLDASNEISIVANSALDMEGGKFALNAGKGEGAVKAAAILEVKGSMVKINS